MNWQSWGVTTSMYDPALFYWHAHNELHDLTTIHVDDISWGSTALFAQHVIQPFQ